MKKQASTDAEKIARILADMSRVFPYPCSAADFNEKLALTLIARALGVLLTDLKDRLEGG